MKKLEEFEALKKLRGDWMPTEGEKVDFKKDDQSKYIYINVRDYSLDQSDY